MGKRWGRGWTVGINKSIAEHERAERLAAPILADEHGVRHAAGSRADLCPKCQAPPYEPPVVTPIANVNDLLASVCPPHDED